MIKYSPHVGPLKYICNWNTGRFYFLFLQGLGLFLLFIHVINLFMFVDITKIKHLN